MQSFGKELQMYADHGLRPATAWEALGRDVRPGSAPRSRLELRGAVLELFSRDQTDRRVRAQRSK